MNRTLQPQIATSAESSAASALALATLLFLGVLAAAHAQTNYQRIKSFGFLELSGGGPSSALIEGSDGKLYGTGGGGLHSLGTVFKLNTDGSGYTVLHSFGTITGDGSNPSGFAGGLVEGMDGALYGTTSNGGSSDAGTVFKLNKDGSVYTVLLRFSSSTQMLRITLSGSIERSHSDQRMHPVHRKCASNNLNLMTI